MVNAECPAPVMIGESPIPAPLYDCRSGFSGCPLRLKVVDHLDAPRIVLDRNNATRWRWFAEPFGTTAAENNPSRLGPFVFNLRLPGQYFDSESGLHYNFHRDYDPTVGRYVQSDPIGLGGGINTYLYAEAYPTGMADPRGLASTDRVELEGWKYSVSAEAWALAQQVASGVSVTIGPGHEFQQEVRRAIDYLNWQKRMREVVADAERRHAEVVADWLRLEDEFGPHWRDLWEDDSGPCFFGFDSREERKACYKACNTIRKACLLSSRSPYIWAGCVAAHLLCIANCNAKHKPNE